MTDEKIEADVKVDATPGEKCTDCGEVHGEGDAPDAHGYEALIASTADISLARARRKLERAMFDLRDLYVLIYAADGTAPPIALFTVMLDALHVWLDLAPAPEAAAVEILHKLIAKAIEMRKAEAAENAAETSRKGRRVQ
jgi:hypothetical protein